MASLLKSKHGCWTCRLRRKKCDEKHPYCSLCESLTITCYGYGAKPEWMDNGDREKTMGNNIKQIVKKTSRYKGRLGLPLGRFQALSAPPKDERGAMTIAPKLTNVDQFTTWTGTIALTPPSTENETSTASNDAHSRSTPDSEEIFGNLSHDWLQSIKDEEAVLLMHFVDVVFPLQYPMYRPSIVEGGRGWLFSLLLKTKPLYHASLALSAYHRGTVLLASRQQCSKLNSVFQGRHLAVCLSEFRKAIQNAGNWVNTACPKNGLGLMACAIQLIFFELFAGHGDAWLIHLRASTDTFLKNYMDLALQLGLIDSPEAPFDGLTTLVVPDGRPSEESGVFLFLSGVTIWLDVLSSITTGQSPRLLTFHPHAVCCTSSIRLENIMGCRNWAVIQFGRISALHGYKIHGIEHDCLDTAEFDGRVAAMNAELQAGLTEYSLATLEVSSHDYIASSDAPNPETYIISRVFALAASIYLFLVAYGYRLETPELRSLVVEAMILLRTRIPNHLMHAIICPLFIIGSVIDSDQKQFFRHVFVSAPILDPSLEHRGKILPTLEEIWRIRDTTAGWTWQNTVELSGRSLLLI